LRGDGEARRHRDPPPRLRLERPRLLGSARRGAHPRCPGEHGSWRHAGGGLHRQSPVLGRRHDRRAGGRRAGRGAHRRHGAGDAQGPLPGGAQDRQRAGRAGTRGATVIHPVVISTAAGDRGLAGLPSPLPLDELVPATSGGDAGDWEVEIGFGKGRYLRRRCQEDPDRRFLGIEVAGEYHGLFVSRVRRLGLGNWLALRGEALYLLSSVLPAGFASSLHVYFPDPWPKIRHHKRRLFDPETVDLVLRLLRRGAASPSPPISWTTASGWWRSWLATPACVSSGATVLGTRGHAPTTRPSTRSRGAPSCGSKESWRSKAARRPCTPRGPGRCSPRWERKGRIEHGGAFFHA